MGAPDVAEALARITEAEGAIKAKFEKWFKANAMIDYGGNYKTDVYNYWKSGYLIGLRENESA